MLSWNTLQGGLDACGIGQDGGKKNVDPALKPKQPRKPRAKKVGTVVVVRRCYSADHFRWPNCEGADTKIPAVFALCC